MLVLTFRVAEVPYAVTVARWSRWSLGSICGRFRTAPKYLAGLLRYRGGAVPVVDLGLLMGEAACTDRLDTRIILVDSGLRGEVGARYVGLIAERVDDVRRVDESKRAFAGLEIDDAPYLGPVYETDDGLLQLVEPGKILSRDAAEATARMGVDEGGR